MKHFVVEPVSRIFLFELVPNSSSPRGAANLITNTMTTTETDETCESQLVVERTVPAKYVLDPKLLTTELERLFGEGKFAVEVSCEK